MNHWLETLLDKSRDHQNPSPHKCSAELNDASKEDLDAFLASSIANLSYQNRMRATEELHGVIQSDYKETPSIISDWLQILDHYLSAVKYGSAYETAEANDPLYCANSDFRMKFLRANKGNPRKAADQMILFFETKLSLFGEEKLTKEITIDDLDEDDQKCLQDGSFQILPCSDMTGRPVIFGLTCLRSPKTMQNELRSRFYVMMNTVKSVEAQISGVVIVSYAVGKLNRDKRFGMVDNVKLASALPLHWAGVHLCCDDHMQYVLLNAGIRMFQPDVRAKFRLHYGSHLECQHALSTFGILSSALPLSATNNKPQLKNHLEWLERQKILDIKPSFTPSPANAIPEQQLNPKKKEVALFNPADVIFGRGRPTQSHPGNISLRNFLDEAKEEYDIGNLTTRKGIARNIVRQIKCSGGRFMKFGDDGWEEVSDNEARLKVTNAFRSQRRILKIKASTVM
jgi:hypothetical protein